MKDVGKPCEGEPHARIDGGRLETGRRPRSKRKLSRGNAGQGRRDLPSISATAPAAYPPPVRELRSNIRCDQPVRPGTAGRVRGQAPQTQPYLGYAPGDLRVTGQLWPDHLVRNRHCPQAVPALAGTGRTPTVKNVGEPCAGEPHARFDGEGLETEPDATAPLTMTRIRLTVTRSATTATEEHQTSSSAALTTVRHTPSWTRSSCGFKEKLPSAIRMQQPPCIWAFRSPARSFLGNRKYPALSPLLRYASDQRSSVCTDRLWICEDYAQHAKTSVCVMRGHVLICRRWVVSTGCRKRRALSH